MSLRKQLDSDVEMLIELWRNELSLLGVVGLFPKYSNADERKAALSMIHFALLYFLTYTAKNPVDSFASWFLHMYTGSHRRQQQNVVGVEQNADTMRFHIMWGVAYYC